MKKFFSRILGKFREPKWRHGKLAALLMVCFLAVCILLNVGVQALEDEYGWRRDFSFNQYATTGEETKQALDQLTEDVELYLLYQGSEDSQVLQVLDRYAVLSGHISVLPTDIARNPGILTQFSGDLDTALTADTIVVNCPATNRYRVLDYEDFLASGYDIESGTFQVEGLAYEKSLTEAILYVSQDTVPVIGILQGHNELTMETMATLTDFLQSNLYDCTSVNLLRGDTLEGVDLLLIADPQNDLTDGEIDLISAFAQNGGSLFIVRDYTDPLTTMPNYLALLRSYGVIPLPGVAVAGAEDTDTFYGEQLYLIPYMNELDMTLPLIMSGTDILLMPAACAFQTPTENRDSSLSVATVLKTGPHGYVRSLTDGKSTIEKQEGDLEGELSVALYAHRMHANGNVSQMFALGNSTMLTDEYIYQRSDSEDFILAVVSQLAPGLNASLSIQATSAFRPALTAGSQTMGIALLVALPMLVVIAALCILLPRRNR